MLTDILGRVTGGEDLAMDEMAHVIDLVMQGECPDEEIGLLTPLGIELYDSENERQYRNPISLKSSEQVVDKKKF